MKSDTPFVSVIMPVYNGAPFIAEAVDSIQGQSHRPLEIIIIDDGSTDSTADLIQGIASKKGTDLSYICQANLGPAAARNRGLKLAKGDMIAFLDADDLWTEGMLTGQLQRMNREISMQAVVGCTQRVQASQNPDEHGKLQVIGPLWMAFSLGAGLFRRPVFDVVGPFDESLRYGEDVDWFLRAREAGIHIGISNEVTQLYRIHENNMTKDTRESDRHFLAALKKSLDRRRDSGGDATDLAEIPELNDLELVDHKLSDQELTKHEAKDGGLL
jgi:glycosyltransferase involved in cell wall biosynthesis